MVKPLEVSEIILDLRPRLRHSVAFREVLMSMRVLPLTEIEKYSFAMLNQANGIFSTDLYSLVSFQISIQNGEYKITQRGREIIGKRLGISYGDGKEFIDNSAYFRSAYFARLSSEKEEPSEELAEELLNTGDLESNVMLLTNNIGKNLEIDVAAISHDFYSNIRRF